MFANGDSVLLLKIPAYKHESIRWEYLNPTLGISEVGSYLGNVWVGSGKEPLPHCVNLLCQGSGESRCCCWEGTSDSAGWEMRNDTQRAKEPLKLCKPECGWGNSLKVRNWPERDSDRNKDLTGLANASGSTWAGLSVWQDVSPSEGLFLQLHERCTWSRKRFCLAMRRMRHTSETSGWVCSWNSNAVC